MRASDLRDYPSAYVPQSWNELRVSDAKRTETMSQSKLRPETREGDGTGYCPTNGTAYLMVYNAVQTKRMLIHGRLHAGGESCAIGSFWDVNPKCALHEAFIDEVAAVNDSFRGTPRQRLAHMKRWLRWKLAQAGMPGFAAAKKP